MLLLVIRVFNFILIDTLLCGGITIILENPASTSTFSFEVHLKFPSLRNLVFMCVTQMVVSSSCPFCISPVLFVVVTLISSGRGAQRVAHFKTVDFPGPWFILWMAE